MPRQKQISDNRFVAAYREFCNSQLSVWIPSHALLHCSSEQAASKQLDLALLLDRLHTEEEFLAWFYLLEYPHFGLNSIRIWTNYGDKFVEGLRLKSW